MNKKKGEMLKLRKSLGVLAIGILVLTGCKGSSSGGDQTMVTHTRIANSEKANTVSENRTPQTQLKKATLALSGLT